MKKIFLTIDKPVTKAIGRLPASFKRPFHVLGIIFQPVGWGLLLLLYLLIGEPTSTTDILFTLAALPGATIIKLAFRRQRPPTIYAENMRVKSYSFPSSHAYVAALAGTYFISQALAHGWAWLAMALGGLVITMGISRVHLGAHYPSDVAGGLIMGFLVSLLILA